MKIKKKNKKSLLRSYYVRLFHVPEDTFIFFFSIINCYYIPRRFSCTGCDGGPRYIIIKFLRSRPSGRITNIIRRRDITFHSVYVSVSVCVCVYTSGSRVRGFSTSVRMSHLYEPRRGQLSAKLSTITVVTRCPLAFLSQLNHRFGPPPYLTIRSGTLVRAPKNQNVHRYAKSGRSRIIPFRRPPYSGDGTVDRFIERNVYRVCSGSILLSYRGYYLSSLLFFHHHHHPRG